MKNVPPSANSHLPSTKRVAIVHDWLVGGGAELVVEQLHKLYPDAPIYTSYCSAEWRNRLDNKVLTGYLQKSPFKQLRRFIVPLRMLWFYSLNLKNYDLIISSSGNGEAKFVRKRSDALHVNYCHTPTHFYWRHYNEYLKNPSIRPKWLVRIALKLLVSPLRSLDYKAAQKVDHFIANSNHIKNDIKTYYNRDSVVIHPPVDTERFKLNKGAKRDGFITVGRQVPFKKTDLIIEACNELGVKLTVIGRGPEHAKLKKLAGPTVKVIDNATDDEVAKYMSKAEAFIFASFEDFGITPVEAMSAGTPVIAYGAGGALDYVNQDTGILFKSQDVSGVASGIKSFKNKKFENDKIISQSSKFSSASFTAKFEDFIAAN